MPHIALPEGVPGILSAMMFRPEMAEPMGIFTEALLRGPSPLSRGEREIIAAFVSGRNDCYFCHTSHRAIAAHQVDGGYDLVDSVCSNYSVAPVSDKMKALLAIAGAVQKGGKHVTTEAVSAAKEAGATDVEIHDTVLTAAAFCMFNRYVDGLATLTPVEPAFYDEVGARIAQHGYGGLLEQAAGTSAS